MGLAGAPETFQRLMEKVLGDLPYVQCYLDDVSVFSKTVKEHIEHLREVLKRLRDANLTLNNGKCLFGEETIQFLGFEIGHGKKRTTDEKMAIVQKFPQPINRKTLKSFLAFTGYLRPMIEKYAKVVAPLVKAANNRKFEWTDECAKSFAEVKGIVARRPMTHLPDLEKPFVLTTDASGSGMGAVLSQDIVQEALITEYATTRFIDTIVRTEQNRTK